MKAYSTLFGRVALSFIFLISGWSKIGAYAGTQQYMEAMGVPGALLVLVIVLELAGGLAVLFGGYTRWAAIALGLFSLASGVLFHWNLADQMQTIQLMKNIAIAGGFFVLAAHGAGALSVDALRSRRAVAAQEVRS